MSVLRSVCFSALCLLGISHAATAADKSSYIYAPPASENLTKALQTKPLPAKAADLHRAERSDMLVFKTLPPGGIRPASYVLPPLANDDRKGRNYVCGDSKCKQMLPVYNTQTPLDQERGRLGTN
jgi:hypothetical protein